MGNFWQSSGGAALISGVGSLGSGLFGGLFAGRSQKRQYKYNLQLQKQQQEWQKMMWELENEYNLPKNEIARLLQAGVNPAVAFSNGGATAAPVPQSGSAGGVSAPTADMPNIGAAAVAAAQNAQRLENETKVAESTANKQNAEAAEADERAGREHEDARRLRIWNDINEDPEVNKVLRETPVLDRDLKFLDKGIKSFQLNRDEYYTSQYKRRLDLDTRRLEKTCDSIDANIALLKARKNLTDQQANAISIRAQSMLCALYFDQWKTNMARLVNKRIYGSADSPLESSEAFEDVWAAARLRVRNELIDSYVSYLGGANDAKFERGYGLESRRLRMYELPRRQGNYIRSHIYYDGFRTILSGVGDALSGFTPTGKGKALWKSFQKTNQDFHVKDFNLAPNFDEFGNF